ncbi:MAG: hypothetical protein HRT47_10435 [Candidatus Caenarcaniphilales bacterium]|nr:hypothetical protein [Candidatus Caenarcaniphilales bacterium]
MKTLFHMRKKFPANFTDLVMLGFSGWLLKDFGILINEFYTEAYTLDSTLEVLYESFKASAGIIILILRIIYNRRKSNERNHT